MSDHQTLLQVGLDHHQRGEWREAAALYEQLMAARPDWADPYYYLGVLHLQIGGHAQAVPLLQEAVARQPERADFVHHLAEAYRMNQQWELAHTHFEQSLALDPSDPDTHFNFGMLHLQSNQPEPAQVQFTQAVNADATLSGKLEQYGMRFLNAGQSDLAIACFAPLLGSPAAATQATAHNNLGIVRFQQGQAALAEDHLSAAVELQPDFAAAWCNRANVRADSGKLPEAVTDYLRAAELQPQLFQAWHNLAIALQDLGDWTGARNAYQQTLQINPQAALAHYNYGMLLLQLGDWAAGWKEYEWRWRTGEFPPRTFSQPHWDGSSLAGRVLLVTTEQGYGDTLQCIRYALELARAGDQLVVEAPARLLPLLKTSATNITWLAAGEPLPAFDVHCPLLCLPRFWKGAGVPDQVPYLHSQSELVAKWQARMAETPGFRVGICWQGSPHYRRDRYRSVPLELFRCLADLPGVTLFSLQKGAGSEALQQVDFGTQIIDLGTELDEQTGAFEETAAVLQQLDLVVTINSAVAHVAGALGVPTWVVLPQAADWRWPATGDTSPWYPSVRLFRQREWDQWPEVFARVASELAQKASTGGVRPPR